MTSVYALTIYISMRRIAHPYFQNHTVERRTSQPRHQHSITLNHSPKQPNLLPPSPTFPKRCVPNALIALSLLPFFLAAIRPRLFCPPNSSTSPT